VKLRAAAERDGEDYSAGRRWSGMSWLTGAVSFADVHGSTASETSSAQAASAHSASTRSSS